MPPWYSSQKSPTQVLITSAIAMVVGVAAFYSPIHVFGAFVIILILLAIFRHPPNGLYLIILAIPFDSHFVELGFVNLSASNALILVTLIAWLFAHLNAKAHIVQDGNYTLIAVMILGALISTVLAVDMQIHVRSLITLIGCGLTYFLTVNLIRDTKTLNKTLLFLGFAIFVAATVAIIQAIGFRFWGLDLGIGRVLTHIGHGTPLLLPRVTSTFEDPNFYGYFILTGLPMMLYFAFTKKIKNLRDTFVFLPILVILFGLFLSYSRGALVGLAASLAMTFFLLLRQHSSKKSWPVIFTGIIPIILMAGVALFDLIRMPFTFLIDLSPESVAARIELLGLATNAILANPVTGLGFGGFLKQHGIDTHNIFMQLITSVGLFGFLPFFILFVKTLHAGTVNSRTRLGGALFVSIVGVFAAAFFIDIFFIKSLWFFIGLINAALKILGLEE